MREAIEGGGHLGIAEDGGPFRGAEIGGDDDAGALVELAQQVEEQGAARGAEGQVAQLIEDDEIGVSEPAGELAGLALGLFLFEGIDELDGGEEAGPLGMVLDGLDSESRGDMGLAGARPSHQDDVVSILEELATMQLADERLVDFAAGEVEAIEVAIGREARGLELIGR
jgi:hypothetical protein